MTVSPKTETSRAGGVIEVESAALLVDMSSIVVLRRIRSCSRTASSDKLLGSDFLVCLD